MELGYIYFLEHGIKGELCIVFKTLVVKNSSSCKKFKNYYKSITCNHELKEDIKNRCAILI